MTEIQPMTAMERTAWSAMLAELPAGARPHAVRWRNGEYQVAADLPKWWHRPYSQIPQDAYGRGPTLIHAIAAFRDNLAGTREALSRPGQTIWLRERGK